MRKTAPMTDDLLTTKQAAERLGCHIGTIRYRIATGKLEPTLRVTSGGTTLVFFSVEDLDAHIREHPPRPGYFLKEA